MAAADTLAAGVARLEEAVAGAVAAAPARPARLGQFKTEVIKQVGPWKTMQDVERETMHWVDWYIENRLLSSIGYVPPAEAERRHLERIDPVDKVA